MNRILGIFRMKYLQLYYHFLCLECVKPQDLKTSRPPTISAAFAIHKNLSGYQLSELSGVVQNTID